MNKLQEEIENLKREIDKLNARIAKGVWSCDESKDNFMERMQIESIKLFQTKKCIEIFKEIVEEKVKEYEGLEQLQEANWVLETLKWVKSQLEEEEKKAQ